jgi:hypothetical protein
MEHVHCTLYEGTRLCVLIAVLLVTVMPELSSLWQSLSDGGRKSACGLRVRVLSLFTRSYWPLIKNTWSGHLTAVVSTDIAL